MSTERTFIAVKPDGVQRGIFPEILRRFQNKGFKLVGIKLTLANESLLREHYSDLQSKPFFPSLLSYMLSGPILATVWEGKDVVKQGRVLLGATNPLQSAPGTIRGDFALDMGRNIIHGSDSVESAEKEISLWFKKEELVEYKPTLHGWIYEVNLLTSGRQPRTVQLIRAQPEFQPVGEFQPPSLETRCSAYSPNGTLFAYTQPTGVSVCDSESGKLLFTISVPDVFDMQFSPQGTFLTTWSKPTKLSDDSGNWANNVTIWKLDLESSAGVPIQSYLNKSQSGWKAQFTSDETIFCRLINLHQIDFYKSQEAGQKPLYSINVKDIGQIQSFQMSPGKNPSIALFVPGSKGKQSYIQVYSLPNVKTPTSQKQFFNGESCQFTWNDLGTSILALVSTDVDSSNKSYYGQTTLYLLGISGAFDQRIALDKEGPIHDITWSPTSREFAVIYGYMPSQTTFFDARGNAIHSLPQASSNTILFSPHARFILVAGFGNLQGDVNILDRQNKFNKVASFKASNTSVCKWSPDGRYILTATTSPRLRVDNCVKIWHVSGSLCYVKEFSELYSVDWRFQPLADFPPIRGLDESCAPDISAVEYLAKRTKVSSASDKPAGAYRPPHARNQPAKPVTTLAQREALQRKKQIPGAAPAKKQIPGAVEPAKPQKPKKKKEEEKQEPVQQSESLVIGGVISYEEKKIRNLLKKLRAIEQLKQKKDNGEFLEDTQVLKIQTESQVRKELASLGWSG
ncbi:hypothetical protein OGAPHI_007458 [Ogataea philodendri]|uniref:Eukaryotic translation initiation factor 2A n=2 Tax=Saccharomycotina TaxID=147537 RepID=A0A9P8NUS1_9ASCO|nr:uncharacterized protein OGAPHI_007458 [Ogataea philodendri]KAH3660253.1 hypothetical protein OGAPHI_007458 [Ogataea philodendri]